MTPRASRSSLSGFRGFTLIELLTVIAIIGILAAITIPTVQGARDSARKTKVRVQFTTWAGAIRDFKNAYGYFPKFEGTNNSDNHKVNGGVNYNSSAMGDDDYLFREILGGQGAQPKSDGGFDFYSDEKTPSKRQNKGGVRFTPFDSAEISSKAAGDTLDGAIKDTFGNVEIAVIVDRNGDGFVNRQDLKDVTVFPALTAHENRGTLTSAQVQDRIDAATPTTATYKPGVRADVIFYSPGRGVTPGKTLLEKDAVWSW